MNQIYVILQKTEAGWKAVRMLEGVTGAFAAAQEAKRLAEETGQVHRMARVEKTFTPNSVVVTEH